MTKILKRNRNKVTFEVPLPDSRVAYMSAERIYSQEAACDKYVVIVNAAKFLKLWQNSGDNKNCKGVALYPEKWSSDYKYEYAVSGFAAGIDNPVPLAEPSAQREELHELEIIGFFRKVHYVYQDLSQVPKIILNKNLRINTTYKEHVVFTNGITRTLWLLNNGALNFPVNCDGSNLSSLLKAKEKNTRIYSYAEFFHE